MAKAALNMVIGLKHSNRNSESVGLCLDFQYENKDEMKFVRSKE